MWTLMAHPTENDAHFVLVDVDVAVLWDQGKPIPTVLPVGNSAGRAGGSQCIRVRQARWIEVDVHFVTQL